MDKIVKSDKEWEKELPYETFCIMRQQGTEAPFSNKYWDNHEEGQYFCAACHNLLFLSDTKFESGTGWPSYFQPADPQALTEKRDIAYGMIRTGGELRPLRRPPGPRLPRWAQAHGPALLHQQRRAQF